MVNKKVNKAGLVDILGEAGETNIQGEEQKKPDVFADQNFIAALRASDECCGIITEENKEYWISSRNLCIKGSRFIQDHRKWLKKLRSLLKKIDLKNDQNIEPLST
ncbi:Fructose-1,6-bisphosphatase class 1 [subsurface metagenome]